MRRVMGMRLPSPTRTALQVSPYDSCAPVRDICVSIMLNRPYCGSTLQVAGTCVTRPPSPGSRQVVGWYWGNGLVEGQRGKVGGRPVSLPGLLCSSTESFVDREATPDFRKGRGKFRDYTRTASRTWEWRRGRKANWVSLDTSSKRWVARQPRFARPSGAQVPGRGDPRGQPRVDEGKGPAADGRRVGCGTA